MAPTFRRPSLADGSLRRNHGHARGCKRTHLTFKEKATRWNRDKEIQNILADMQRPSLISPGVGKYLTRGSSMLRDYAFNQVNIMNRRLPYERLGQLPVDILLGSQQRGCEIL